MRHVFIINPMAGKRDSTDLLRACIDRLSADTDIYVTTSPGDATRYVRERCLQGDATRFYACGGDGTLGEVVAGAVGFAGAEVGCVPVGSGNDYVRYYGGAGLFADLEVLVSSASRPVDVMKLDIDGVSGSRYSINVCNFGFDAVVCRTMVEVRRKFLIGGRNAYTTGIVKALFTGRRTRCRVSVDGLVVHDGEILLCTLGNGGYVGGGYHCSPRSENDDGLVEVCLFRPISLLRFMRLLGPYRDGSFIERDDVKDFMTYRRGSAVDVEAPQAIDFCVDGEMVRGSRFHIEQLPRAVRFIVPRE